MKLQRVTDNGNNLHRGKAFMVLVCKDEAELDQMMNIINNQMGWKADCSFCSDDGNDISWFIDSTSGGAEIDFFKADYKAAKKQLQHNRPGER